MNDANIFCSMCNILSSKINNDRLFRPAVNFRAAQQISCQSCVGVLYLFLRHRPGGECGADRLCVSVAGVGRDRLAANRSRPEMAPQRLEMIESAPGNGMGSEPWTHNIWCIGARLTVRDSG
jgi:hypothetical protein